MFVFPLYSVYLWKYADTSHTSIYLPINGLSEKVVCVQREARYEAGRKWIERECGKETERQRRTDRREAVSVRQRAVALIVATERAC